MPPRKAKQDASVATNEVVSTVPANVGEQSRTPEQHPTKKAAAGMTQAQKQALVDNIQLEITERARKLRAQYALQAQGLRTRLEMRVNRIPSALRKRKMQDLVDEHAEKANPKPAAPVPVQEAKMAESHAKEQPKKTSLKRQSDQISSVEDDKENESQDLANPKKRAKTTTTTANTKAVRTASRAKAAPPSSTVLSPRSHNSRTLPRSPFKPGGASPGKPTSQIGRAASPAKSSQPPVPVRGGATRTASRQQPTKKNTRDEGRSSDASNTSASTTIVRKTSGKGGPAAAKKTAAPAKTTAASKKAPAAAAKKEAPQPTAGRSLRKRV